MMGGDYVGGGEFIGGEYVGDEVGGEDVSGLYDIVGQSYDIVGAPRRGQQRQPAQRQPAQRQPARMPGNPSAGVRVMTDSPDIMRRQISPIPLTNIAANSTVDVEFRPQRPLRIERLILDGTVVAGVFLTDLLIGAEPQFVNSGAVPVSAFQPTAFGTDLRGNTAQPGITVTIRLQNTTGAQVTIGGAVIGSSLT
jgi:hypothetical protein